MFCSSTCRMTGFFVGGGGDTTKPGVPQRKSEPVRKHPAAKPGAGGFERVKKMFSLPHSERWAIAKDFTEEERAYARRVARGQLMADDRFVREWDWNEEQDEEAASVESSIASLGDSDDGTV